MLLRSTIMLLVRELSAVLLLAFFYWGDGYGIAGAMTGLFVTTFDTNCRVFRREWERRRKPEDAITSPRSSG